MGKKNKKNSRIEINESIETSEANISSFPKTSKTDENINKINGQLKLKQKKLQNSRDELDIKSENLENTTQKQERNKRKSGDAGSNTIASTSEKKVRSTERESSPGDLRTKNKNIVFSDDGATKEDISKPPKKFLNEDEAEVKDEDIDKFCDEITEEDNKVYENWVEMFEASFKKNKTT